MKESLQKSAGEPEKHGDKKFNRNEFICWTLKLNSVTFAEKTKLFQRTHADIRRQRELQYRSA